LVAWRARSGRVLRKIRAAISRVAGPLMRTIAIAPRPGGVAIAAIVSAVDVAG